MSYSVYKHTFPNGKVYIGITSLNPKRRWNNGRGYLGKINGTYKQPFMANAILKYGWENVKHEILYKGLTKEEAEALEMKLIAQYKSNQKEYGYNIENGGNTSGTHAEETKKKISCANKNKKFSDEHIENLKRSHQGMRGKTHTEETKLKMQKIAQGRVISKETKVKMSNKKKKPVRCIETNKIYHSIKEAKEATGINHISMACNNKIKTAGGYHWEFIK